MRSRPPASGTRARSPGTDGACAASSHLLRTGGRAPRPAPADSVPSEHQTRAARVRCASTDTRSTVAWSLQWRSSRTSISGRSAATPPRGPRTHAASGGASCRRRQRSRPPRRRSGPGATGIRASQLGATARRAEAGPSRTGPWLSRSEGLQDRHVWLALGRAAPRTGRSDQDAVGRRPQRVRKASTIEVLPMPARPGRRPPGGCRRTPVGSGPERRSSVSRPDEGRGDLRAAGRAGARARVSPRAPAESLHSAMKRTPAVNGLDERAAPGSSPRARRSSPSVCVSVSSDTTSRPRPPRGAPPS